MVRVSGSPCGRSFLASGEVLKASAGSLTPGRPFRARRTSFFSLPPWSGRCPVGTYRGHSRSDLRAFAGGRDCVAPAITYSFPLEQYGHFLARGKVSVPKFIPSGLRSLAEDPVVICPSFSRNLHRVLDD